MTAEDDAATSAEDDAATSAADAGTPPVRYQAGEGRAVLTLDSPRNRNALSPRLVAGLRDGLARAAADPDVRAVVLTHTGGTFCAGADLSAASGAAAAGGAGRDAPSPTEAMAGLLRALLECPRPVIGLIDGHVRAGGMGLVGACDMVVAGPACTFALTEARLGLAPSIISLTLLPRLDPRAAGRYFLTGERFGPDEAQRMGLVTAAADDPDAAVDGLLAGLRKASPQGLAETKALLTRGMLEGFDAHAQELCALSARLFATPDAREGMTAFLQKRRPSWEL